MDAFSWLRQKRQGIRPIVEKEVRIPLVAAPTVGFIVYFRHTADTPLPTEEQLKRFVQDWLDDHAEEPLREGLEAFLEQDFLSLQIHERDGLPEPPDEILRAYNPGETEERRFRNANHAILVGAPDLLAPPRIGLWSVIAASRALASYLPGGVIVAPAFPRLLPLETLSLDLPLDGYVRLVEHILIPYSVDSETGLAWMTTKGMEAFGLPEIEIRDVPPNLVNGLMPVMNGMAQRLAAAAMQMVAHSEFSDTSDLADEQTSARETRQMVPEFLRYPAQFWFTLADVRHAYDASEDTQDSEGSEDSAEIEERKEQREGEGEPRLPWERFDVPGSTTATTAATLLRLEVTPRRRGGDDEDSLFVRLVPPHGVRYDPGVWLNDLLTDLFGSDPQIAAVETGDQFMEKAHQEAVRELPLIRERFRAGFRSGEILHIKHGFPTEGEGHEYMWIVVTHWGANGRIQGHIANDPQYRRDLRAGQAVEISEDEVYDWLIVHTDGRTEGAYTNRALGDEDDEPV